MYEYWRSGLYIFCKINPLPPPENRIFCFIFLQSNKIILLSSAGEGGEAVFVFKNINPYGKNLNNIYLPSRSSILLEFL